MHELLQHQMSLGMSVEIGQLPNRAKVVEIPMQVSRDHNIGRGVGMRSIIPSLPVVIRNSIAA